LRVQHARDLVHSLRRTVHDTPTADTAATSKAVAVQADAQHIALREVGDLRRTVLECVDQLGDIASAHPTLAPSSRSLSAVGHRLVETLESLSSRLDTVVAAEIGASQRLCQVENLASKVVAELQLSTEQRQQTRELEQQLPLRIREERLAEAETLLQDQREALRALESDVARRQKEVERAMEEVVVGRAHAQREESGREQLEARERTLLLRYQMVEQREKEAKQLLASATDAQAEATTRLREAGEKLAEAHTALGMVHTRQMRPDKASLISLFRQHKVVMTAAQSSLAARDKALQQSTAELAAQEAGNDRGKWDGVDNAEGMDAKEARALLAALAAKERKLASLCEHVDAMDKWSL